MVVTGAYLTWYGIYELRVQGGAQDGGGPVDTVFGCRATCRPGSATSGRCGSAWSLGLVAAVAALVALLRIEAAGRSTGSAGPIGRPAGRAPATGYLAGMDLRIFTEPQQGATYDDLLAVAQTAEELGFDAFFRSDHYLKMGDVDGLPGPDRRVDHARRPRPRDHAPSGSARSSPPATFRLPGPLAISVAQVDAMSGGRVELGIGAGWYDDEHAAYGIPFPPLGERFDRLEEQLAIITGLWETPVGETFSFDGRALPARRLAGAAQAGAAPRPPIDHRRRRAEAHAARWPPRTPTSSTCRSRRSRTSPAAFGRVRAACEDVGRDPGDARSTRPRWCVCCGARRGRGRRGGPRRSGATSTSCGRTASAGTPAEVVDTLGRYADAGATRDLPPGARPRRPRPPPARRRRGLPHV